MASPKSVLLVPGLGLAKCSALRLQHVHNPSLQLQGQEVNSLTSVGSFLTKPGTPIKHKP